MTDTMKDTITGRWMYLMSSLNTAHLWYQTVKGFRPICKSSLSANCRDMLVDADVVMEEAKIKLCKDCRSVYRTGHNAGAVVRRRG